MDCETVALLRILIQISAALWFCLEGYISKCGVNFAFPGLKHSFIDALRIGTKRQGKFDMSSAKRKLDDYYKK